MKQPLNPPEPSSVPSSIQSSVQTKCSMGGGGPSRGGDGWGRIGRGGASTGGRGRTGRGARARKDRAGRGQHGRGRTERGELDGCIMHWVHTSVRFIAKLNPRNIRFILRDPDLVQAWILHAFRN
jgi:hypothetical protein